MFAPRHAEKGARESPRPLHLPPLSRLGVCGGASAGNFVALLLPAEDGFTNSRHCFYGFDAGAFGAGVGQLEHAWLIILVLHAALADWRYPLDQIVRHRRFALDAADARGTAGRPPPLLRPPRRGQSCLVL